ncbi:MAG: AAA family ATPase [Oscillochloridaceae bacterium umkhey_bin13]
MAHAPSQTHELLVACLERLAAAERDPLQAVTRYQALVAADPLREQAHLGLMRALARAGLLIAVLEQFVTLEQLLQAEFGLPPSATTLTLVAQVQAQITREREQSQALAQRQLRPPFVGRLAERAELMGRLAAARAGHGWIALILGEPGMGKTRLAEEIATAALWEGWQPYWGRSEALALAPPYAPLLAALQAALPLPRLQQLRPLVPAEALKPVTELLWPDQAEPDQAGRDHAASYQRLAAALAAVLAGLATLAPPLIILDDVQWAAPDLWPLLEALREPLAGVPVMLLVLGRAELLHGQSQPNRLRNLWLIHGDPLIRLRPLTQAELSELVLGWGRSPLSEPDLVALAATSGGSPLLALNGLRHAPEAVEAASWEAMVASRLGQLDPAAQAALACAAVIGRQVAYPLWEACLHAEGLTPELILNLAAMLERAASLELNEQGYMFAHDRLREALLAVLAPVERQTWHRRILALLAQQAPDDPAILLHHAEGAGSGRDCPLRANQWHPGPQPGRLCLGAAGLSTHPNLPAPDGPARTVCRHPGPRLVPGGAGRA